MPALDLLIGNALLILAVLFGAVDVLVYLYHFRRTRGQRRFISGLILFISSYAVSIYGLSFAGLLPDGADTLSLLLRPVVAGLLGFMAVLGLLERRR